MRKKGAGGGNLGTITDELKGRDRNKTDDDDEQADVEEDEATAKQTTLEDYYKNLGKDFKDAVFKKEQVAATKKDRAIDQETL